MKKNKVVIVSSARTPIGSFMGSLSTIAAPQLGAYAISGALKKIQLNPKIVQEVYLGNVLSAGIGQAPARQAALLAGIGETTPCTTINKVCSSGMKAIQIAAQSIAIGDNEIVVAGGMENMSLVPHYGHIRNGKKYGGLYLEDGLQKDGLTDAYNQKAMGVCGDLCALNHNISRKEQDQYTIQSYQRAQQAWEQGYYKDEVVPIPIEQRDGTTNYISKDEEYLNFKPEKIASLRPAFSPDGTITAANASTLSDGAAALVLMSESKAIELGLQPIAEIIVYADAAQKPELFTTSPAIALQKALEKADMTIDMIDFFEINEAFAVVSLANAKIMGIDPEKMNIFGGAVSLGHPLGCSGARITTTLLSVLQQQKGNYGAAAICNGGGGASAIIIKRLN
ncbi:MAG: acetyl-CoA C-acyltransferase [Flavobacteriales bacterium]|nr:acetyl-CoA C-acyltransferase [Flavobacteriales bacterium]